MTIALNEEQRFMVALLRSNGCPDPEGMVRAEPFEATVMGSALLPPKAKR